MVSSNNFYLIIIKIYFHVVIWLYVFLFNTNKLYAVIWFPVILRQIISNRSILPKDGTLSGTTMLDQRGPGSNVNKEVTLHFQKFQNWSLITRCSLVSY